MVQPFSSTDLLNLSKEGTNRLSLDEFSRLVQVVINQRLGINTKRMIDGRQDLARMDRIFQRRRSGLVGLAVDLASLDTGTGKYRRVTIRPVITPVVAIAIAGCAHPA